MNCAQASDEDLCLTGYRFPLPQEQIAQFPPAERGTSRLMILRRGPASDDPPTCLHSHFSELLRFLPKGALLVANNSRVLEARLLTKRATGGKIEFLLLTPLPLLLAKAVRDPGQTGQFTAEAEGLTRSSASLQKGEVLHFGKELSVQILERQAFGRTQVRLAWQGDLTRLFSEIGHIPLPPYIRREDESRDKERYQTVYAKKDKTGSVAAPTAGLHFTTELRTELLAHGIAWSEVTLYVGYGTFSPVRTQDIRQHVMHSEYVEISEETARLLRSAKEEGRPIIAVGTTSLRALEGMMLARGSIQPYQGFTDIFLYPGKTLQLVDGLLTNFHLPESSLLMLVAALTGRKRILHAYEEAVQRGYRFFSYGDAMLILPEEM